MEQKIIEIKELSVHFKTMDGDVKAVNDVSLSVRRGQTLGLVCMTGTIS